MIDPATLRCKCGCDDPTTVTILTLAGLNTMEAMGCAIRPTCGVRCPVHNSAVGGAGDSRHLPVHADAVDVACTDSVERFRLVKCAIAAGFSFIEVCPAHVHVDRREGALRLILGSG